MKLTAKRFAQRVRIRIKPESQSDTRQLEAFNWLSFRNDSVRVMRGQYGVGEIAWLDILLPHGRSRD